MNISKKKYEEMQNMIDSLSIQNVRLQRSLDERMTELTQAREALRARLLAEDSLMALNGLANAISKTIEKVYK